MSARPLLVVGAAGQVGRELVALAERRGVPLVAVTRYDVDIADPDAVARAIAATRPRLVVNAAAYTAVDKAESEPDAAQAANADGPAVLAEATARADVPLLHISTDYVFDGSKAGPYTEDDPLAPLGVYGRSKAEGEARVRAANPRHVIVRTAWVYGAHGNNFLKTMLRLARERDELRVVADQRGCPTATVDIAEAILAIDALVSRATGAEREACFGTFHFAGEGATTWHGFARAIVEAQAIASGRMPPVTPIPTSAYPTPARRPANSELDSTRFAATFGLRAAPWRQRTVEVVEALCFSEAQASPNPEAVSRS